MSGKIVILGVFVADTTYRADRLPNMGETLLGNSFALGPGGKGSNQAVAAARTSSEVHFISRLGKDAFADMAMTIWQEAGVTPAIIQEDDSFTGAAFIFVEETSGNNAIIISPGAAADISASDLVSNTKLIESADIFVTQLEQPLAAAAAGLEIARRANVRTILNPAPATEPLPTDVLKLCDFVTPNEAEAEGLTGVKVINIPDAEAAATKLLELGAGAVIITLGEQGAFFMDQGTSLHVAAIDAGPVVETTGAGDAFNGGFASALALGKTAVDAVRFGCATAAISVTRPGTAASMPAREEVEALLAKVSS